jgi:hypothetical protein
MTQTCMQLADKINMPLVNPLAFLPGFTEANAQQPRQTELVNLALHNLLRGMSMGLFWARCFSCNGA